MPRTCLGILANLIIFNWYIKCKANRLAIQWITLCSIASRESSSRHVYSEAFVWLYVVAKVWSRLRFPRVACLHSIYIVRFCKHIFRRTYNGNLEFLLPSALHFILICKYFSLISFSIVFIAGNQITFHFIIPIFNYALAMLLLHTFRR